MIGPWCLLALDSNCRRATWIVSIREMRKLLQFENYFEGKCAQKSGSCLIGGSGRGGRAGGEDGGRGPWRADWQRHGRGSPGKREGLQTGCQETDEFDSAFEEWRRRQRRCGFWRGSRRRR